MTREEVLEAARGHVCGDRDQQYGAPRGSFPTIAEFWSTYLSRGLGVDVLLDPHDVAAMMILFKMARVAGGVAKEDNWADAAGYAACGGELQTGGADTDAG